MTATVNTTTVSKLVDIAMVKAQQPDADHGTQEGVIGYTPEGEPIACGVAWTSEATSHGGHRMAHIEEIVFDPEPEVVIGPFGDYFHSAELEDTLWDAEEKLEEEGKIFDDLIRESGVEYSDPDTKAKWKGGQKEHANHEYWISDVDALIQHIRENYC